MTVTKAVLRGILIASLAGSSAKASSMLVLGVNSNSSSTPSVATGSTPFNSSYFQPTQSAGLTLGIMSNASSSSYSSNNSYSAPTSPTPTDYSASQSFNLAPTASSSSTNSAPAPAGSNGPVYDAQINFGSGPFPNASSLTTGNAQSWFLSPAVDKLFGGVPTASQQSAFDTTVLQRVQQTFSQSGVPVNLTDDPNAQAAHTLSVVSGTTNPTLNNAIGMTYLGGNGFHFIDNSAAAAQSVDQLEWIVAHNIAHELMLAFNVPENYDQTGNYIDARNASFAMMTNPNATFSPAAVTALLAQNFQNSNANVLSQGAQLLGPETVPEPTTVILWTAIAGVGLVVQRRRIRTAASRV